MSTKRLASGSLARIVLYSLLFTIILGSLALALPVARTGPISWIDLLFTATSATCVTGLFTIPLDQFTLFGKSIILLLIQIGGLGLITMMLGIMIFFVKFNKETQIFAGQVLDLESWRNIRYIILCIMGVTILMELIGALFFMPILVREYPIGYAIFLSVFHSVSSFCSAGISLFDPGLQHYSAMYGFLLITAALMFIGELGYVTWYEILRYVRACVRKRSYRFSLHSKIVLYGSVSLVLVTAIIFWILERDNVLAGMPLIQAVINALFYAVSFKSTGFLLVTIAQLHMATLCIIMFFSFIGSAPGSTGSGIKITTFAVFVSTVQAAVAGKTSVDIKGRHITLDQVFKTIAIVSLGLGWIMATTFCLLLTEPQWPFMDILFEASSAFTNIGIASGVTPTLSFIGKLIIMLSMFIGRIGSLTFVLALKLRGMQNATLLKCPEERIMIG